MYSFPYLELVCCFMSSSNCCFLTSIQIPQEAGLVFPSLEEFYTVCCDPHGQRLRQSQQNRSRCFSGTLLLFQWFNGCFNKTEVDVFLELSCFFNDSMDVGNLISDSSAFSKSSLNIWKFTVHVLLKSGLENFEQYFASMWGECNCAVVEHSLALPFFGIGMKTDLFQSCSHCEFFKFAGIMSAALHRIIF